MMRGAFSEFSKWRLAQTIFYYVLAVLLLSSAAIWNGFPFLYPDSATYIASGYILETPVDRPITYGLFLRVVTLGFETLWGAVFVQSYLVAFVLLRLVRVCGFPAWTTLLVLFAACLAGLPFLTGQIITDVFATLMVLSAFVFIREVERSQRVSWKVLGLFLLSFSMHGSHLPIMLGLLLPIGLITYYGDSAERNMRLRNLGILLFVMMIGYIPLNISAVKSGNQFYAAHLAETGILRKYLQKYCADQKLRMCALKDSLPKSAEHFMWHPDGVAAMYSTRLEGQREFSVVIKGVFNDSELRFELVKTTGQLWRQQLEHNAIGEGLVPFREHSNVYNKFQEYLPDQLSSMQLARQYRNPGFQNDLDRLSWRASIWNQLSLLIVLIACASACIKRGSHDTNVLSWIALSYFLLSALVNSGFVMVANRFGAKAVWILAISGSLWVISMWRALQCHISSRRHEAR